jgi:transposase
VKELIPLKGVLKRATLKGGTKKRTPLGGIIQNPVYRGWKLRNVNRILHHPWFQEESLLIEFFKQSWCRDNAMNIIL